MSRDLNIVCLIGRLTADPVAKYTQDGKPYTNISLAINDDFKEKKNVYFVEVAFFGVVADVICKYTLKGNRIQVTGKLKQDTWLDKTSGQKRSKLTVMGQEAQLIESKPNPINGGANLSNTDEAGGNDLAYIQDPWAKS